MITLDCTKILTNFNQYAKGKDLKEPHPPCYVLISRKDLYTTGFEQMEIITKYYDRLWIIAVAAPNYGIHEKMNHILIEKLSLSPM